MGRAEAFAHHVRPDLACRPVLGDLFEKSLCALKKAQPGADQLMAGPIRPSTSHASPARNAAPAPPSASLRCDSRPKRIEPRGAPRQVVVIVTDHRRHAAR